MTKRAALEQTAWNKVAFRRLWLEPGHYDLCHLDLDLNTDQAAEFNCDSQRTPILGAPREPGCLAPGFGKPANWGDPPTTAARKCPDDEANAHAAAADEEATERIPSLISTLASVEWDPYAVMAGPAPCDARAERSLPASLAEPGSRLACQAGLVDPPAQAVSAGCSRDRASTHPDRSGARGHCRAVPAEP